MTPSTPRSRRSASRNSSARPTSRTCSSSAPAATTTDRYSRRVGTFDWEGLFKRAPGVYRAFGEKLAERYRYVLIDSRTGVTDISGICTYLLPERLVVVFTPNRQSLTGVRELIERATSYRRGSDDLRPLLVFPLPSRIEASLQDLRARWRFGDPDRDVIGYQPMFQELFTAVVRARAVRPRGVLRRRADPADARLRLRRGDCRPADGRPLLDGQQLCRVRAAADERRAAVGGARGSGHVRNRRSRRTRAGRGHRRHHRGRRADGAPGLPESRASRRGTHRRGQPAAGAARPARGQRDRIGRPRGHFCGKGRQGAGCVGGDRRLLVAGVRRFALGESGGGRRLAPRHPRPGLARRRAAAARLPVGVGCRSESRRHARRARASLRGGVPHRHRHARHDSRAAGVRAHRRFRPGSGPPAGASPRPAGEACRGRDGRARPRRPRIQSAGICGTTRTPRRHRHPTPHRGRSRRPRSPCPISSAPPAATSSRPRT